MRPSHPAAGTTVKIKQGVNGLGGEEFRVEDYWDNVSGNSWRDSIGNPACINYAIRAGSYGLPFDDDEVLYGKIGPFGHLVHVSELDL